MQTLRWKSAAFAMVVAVLLMPGTGAAQHYKQTNLVSDVADLAAHTDSDLVNPWGIVRTATSPWWVADNGTGKSTIYNGSGVKQALVVTVPPATGSTPTGIVANGTTTIFLLSASATSGARFIFATEDGTISGWNPAVNATNGIIKVNNSGTTIYKGLAIGTMNGSTVLYATNFSGGKVDVFDSNWTQKNTPGAFVDPEIPAGYVPFGIQNIDGNIFVTFALQGTLPDEVDGRKLGYVDKFDGNGNLLLRLQHGPWLNAPWGVAKAPADFGLFSNNILVGNFGSGEIAAFDATTGEFLGRLHGPKGTLVIPGLWAIAFGGGTTASSSNGLTNELFFSAGIDGEEHGLFGKLTAAKNGKGDDDE